MTDAQALTGISAGGGRAREQPGFAFKAKTPSHLSSHSLSHQLWEVSRQVQNSFEKDRIIIIRRSDLLKVTVWLNSGVEPRTHVSGVPIPGFVSIPHTTVLSLRL
jgi:hypothetical protein